MDRRYEPIIGIAGGVLLVVAIALPSPLDTIAIGLACLIAFALLAHEVRAIRRSSRSLDRTVYAFFAITLAVVLILVVVEPSGTVAAVILGAYFVVFLLFLMFAPAARSRVDDAPGSGV